MRERLALAIEDGRGDFAKIERACIAKALRARAARQKRKREVPLSPRLLYTAKKVQSGDLVLERCPIPRYEKNLILKYLARH